jgi:AraC-like DNA-binding protein
MIFHRPKGVLAGFSWSNLDDPASPLLEAGEQWVPRDRPIPEHRNPGWEIYYQPAGRSRWECEGGIHEVLPGGYYLAAPRARHRLVRFEEAETHFYYAVLPERCLPGGAIPDWPGPFSAGAGAFTLENAFRGLVRELTLEGPDRAEALACYAAALRIEIGRLLVRPAASRLGLHPAVTRACELIEGRPEDRWRLDELASLCGVSVAHLVSLFRRDLGQPPRQYLLRRRVERAEELLRSSGRSITDVAHELGFASSQHFAKVFKKIRGRSPSRVADRRVPAGSGSKGGGSTGA